MSDAAFLRAILEDPDDDTSRLVYADWLDEHGDPDRAEFIRVQCALARMAEDEDGRWELQARERQLLWRHGKGWAGPLRRLVTTVLLSAALLIVASCGNDSGTVGGGRAGQPMHKIIRAARSN